MFSSPSRSNEHNINVQMETTSVNATTSTQTEVINTTRDKCIGSAVKYKNKKSTIQG